MIKRAEEKAIIGKVYFYYLALVLLPQIIGFSAKGTFIDTAWKAAVIIGMLYQAFKQSDGKIRRYVVIPMVLYAFGQMMVRLVYGNGGLIVNVFVILAMIYLFVSVSTRRPDECFDDIDFFCNAFIYLTLYAVVYNLFVYPTAVFNFLSVANPYSDMMSSFFDNKQTFGMFLFVALIAATWQYLLTKKRKYLVFTFIFLLNMFICLSRTALVACSVYIVAVCVLMVFTDRSLSRFFITVLVIGVVLVCLVPQLRHFVQNVLFDTEDTMNARTNIWESAFKALQGNRLWIGYGEGKAALALKPVLGYGANTHNGIVQVLMTGGVLKLSLYALVLFYAIYCSLAFRKYNKTLAFLCLATIVSVFIYSMGEALVWLDTSAPCIVASILCIAFPIRIKAYYAHKYRLIVPGQ